MHDDVDVKNTFLTTLTSLDLWPLDYDNPQACIISSLLKRINCTGSLELAAIAFWLRNDVGLTAYDVVARFTPFAQRVSNASSPNLPAIAEEPPATTDDSLSDFGDDLDWTPAHGPCGPHLKPRQVASQSTALPLGPADASTSQ